MNTWVDIAVEQLAGKNYWSYPGGTINATEPTALTALALLAHGQLDAAQRPIDWLVRQQAAEGTLGVTSQQSTPCWPTSLAILAWHSAQREHAHHRYQGCIDRAVDWLLGTAGTTLDQQSGVGHDTTIPGWPWVMGTHSWIEPTAFSCRALIASGRQDHLRTRHGQDLLVDRLLSRGGCNYGNSVVLGQELLPHMQPSGIALLAIAPTTADPRVERTIDYLSQGIDASTATASLSWALLGLAAHDHFAPQADTWLAHAFARVQRRGVQAYHLALLLLAAQGAYNPLILARNAALGVTTG